MSANIVLIEPDRQLGKIYQIALKDVGYQVRIGSTAQSALRVLDERLPDLIILEPQLAKHGGIEFLYELRSYQDWQSVPVVINSLIPLATLKRSQTGLDELGVLSILYKPETSIKQLLNACQEVLALSIKA